MSKLGSLFAFALLAVAAFSAPVFATVPDAPEIDPGSIVSAVTLLSGGMLILNDRRRRAK